MSDHLDNDVGDEEKIAMDIREIKTHKSNALRES